MRILYPSTPNQLKQEAEHTVFSVSVTGAHYSQNQFRGDIFLDIWGQSLKIEKYLFRTTDIYSL